MRNIDTLLHVIDILSYLILYSLPGTTWTLEIMSAILHDGDIEVLNKTYSWQRGHFLEITFGGHQNRDVRTLWLISLIG